MKIIVNRANDGSIYAICVVREEGDSPFYGTVGAKGESNFLHQVKLKLNAMGFDLIKKRMCKDGHMMDDMQQYLRSRRPDRNNPDRNLSIYNGHWAIRGLNDDFNKGEALLRVTNFLETEDQEKSPLLFQ